MVALLAILVGILVFRADANAQRAAITVYCAAVVHSPVSAVAAAYEKECGARVRVHGGGSGTLLANLELDRSGDLYIAADASYVQIAADKGLVHEQMPLARLRAVVGVRRGNPKKIDSAAGLLRPDVRVSLANPEAASIGAFGRTALRRAGLWDELEARALVFKPTVADVANDIKLGTVDAGIIWDITSSLWEDVEAVRDPVLEHERKLLILGVLRSSRRIHAAREFARYLSAADRGLEALAASGFEVVEGQPWVGPRADEPGAKEDGT